MSTIIEVKNLRYSYKNNNEILKGINVKFREKEKVAIIGANGAGKSTFFLNINGVLSNYEGDIIYRNNIITSKSLNELRRNIGIVFQDADSQIIASTVMAEVSFGPMNLKLPKNEVKNRVDKALQYMNIVSLKDKAPHYLSGGEKKRVSIADIIAMNCEIIIFDEPTASLDPLNIEIFEDVLHKMYKEDKTIIISTHDMDFAYRWAERIIVFHDGMIIADDTPFKVFSDNYILKKANLKSPILFEVYNIMLNNNLIKSQTIVPTSIEEFKQILSG